MKEKNNPTVLALYPNARGLGYVLFNTPKEIVDFGISFVQPVNNRKVKELIKKYIEYYKPDLVVTRGYEYMQKGKSKRIAKLIKFAVMEARDNNLEIHKYTRNQIHNVFSQFKASSKYQISKVIIGWFPQLKVHAFPYRKRWMSESYNTGVFDAISLAIAHFYLE